jgi:hypothetical protein
MKSHTVFVGIACAIVLAVTITRSIATSTSTSPVMVMDCKGKTVGLENAEKNTVADDSAVTNIILITVFCFATKFFVMVVLGALLTSMPFTRYVVPVLYP